MRSLTEPQFHMLMVTLVVASLFADQELPHLLPSWNMPKIGLVTFTLGLCWMALFAGHRVRNLHQRIEVLQDKVDRLSNKTDALEADARHRRKLMP